MRSAILAYASRSTRVLLPRSSSGTKKKVRGGGGGGASGIIAVVAPLRSLHHRIIRDGTANPPPTIIIKHEYDDDDAAIRVNFPATTTTTRDLLCLCGGAGNAGRLLEDDDRPYRRGGCGVNYRYLHFVDNRARRFHTTRDVGVEIMDDDGRVSIVDDDRLGEQQDHEYKLENGKYVCPALIEDAIGKSNFISQVVVCGADRPYNVALIVPDWIAIRIELGMPENFISDEELTKSDGARDLIKEEIVRNCYGIEECDVPAAFAFVAPFAAASETGTPKTSIRRDVVLESYEDVISDLYGRGQRGGGGEIRWRSFPLAGGPKVIKDTDEVITPAHDGKAIQFQHGSAQEKHALHDEKDFLPALIEEAIMKSHFISEVVVCGADRPYNVALIVPDWVAIRSELGMPDNFISEEELANSDGVMDLIGAEIERNCYTIEECDVPAAFAFVAPFTAANDVVTPKKSIRRDVILESYEDVISDLYKIGRGEEGNIRWRSFPLDGSPKVIKETEEGITLAPEGKAIQFQHGDIGQLDKDGCASIADHLNQQYKLENGKYVCPTTIEEAIGKSHFISQVVVCGADRPHNVALVVPDWVAIRSELGMPDNFISEEELVNSDGAKNLIGEEITRNCYGIEKCDVPAAFAFVAPFTASNDMITPKKSIRRDVVLKSYEDVISDLYDKQINNGKHLSSKIIVPGRKINLAPAK